MAVGHDRLDPPLSGLLRRRTSPRRTLAAFAERCGPLAPGSDRPGAGACAASAPVSRTLGDGRPPVIRAQRQGVGLPGLRRGHRLARARRRACWSRPRWTPSGRGCRAASRSRAAGSATSSMVRTVVSRPAGSWCLTEAMAEETADENPRTSSGTTTCDVVVIGLGPGGEAVASKLAGAGLSVVGVDERLVGGECPYFGCIPSKMIIRAADAIARGAPRSRARWHVERHARLGPRGAADPRRGDLRLGRPGRRRPAGRRPGCGSCGATPGSPGPRWSRSQWPAGPSGSRRPGASCSTRAPARRCRRSTGSRARRTGPTARSCRSRPCPRRCASSAAVRSAPSWRRRSPGSGCR